MYETGMAQELPYQQVLTGNVRAARAFLGLSQGTIAARMKALGFPRWYPQTVGAVERGERPIAAAELAGLALSLETTLDALTLLPPGAGRWVLMPDDNGLRMPAQRLSINDDSLSWDGDVPVIREAAALPATELRLARGRRELDALADYLREMADHEPEAPGEG
jgi:transcriptional regulator with XRE-family HTH domain